MGLVLLSAGVAACISARIETQQAADVGPSEFASVTVRPIAPARFGDAPYAEDVARSMEQQAAVLLEARGYRIEPVGEAELELRVEPRTEQVTRRTWSSDPDASGYVVRRVAEAVLEIHLERRTATQRLWRGVARSRLPAEDWIVGPSAEQVWMDALLEVVKAVPERSPEADR